MTKTSTLHTTLANHKTLAGLIARALQRGRGMSPTEVRSLAALSMTVSGNLVALVDEIEPRVHLAHPLGWSETHTACGRFTERRTDDRAKVTCKACRGTKRFDETPDA